ncbi:MAG: YciI family protein [Spirochaetaceae bacterium]
MTYLCLAYYDPDRSGSLSKERFQEIVSQCPECDRELKESGRLRSVASLVENEVMTIRTRDGKRLITDGPYVESKEQVGSFFIVEAQDLNDAVRIAQKHPAARFGEELSWAVEVRPIARMEAG